MLCRWVLAEDQLAPSFIDTAQHDPVPPHLLHTKVLSLFVWLGRSVHQERSDRLAGPGSYSEHSDTREQDMTGIELQSEQRLLRQILNRSDLTAGHF